MRHRFLLSPPRRAVGELIFAASLWGFGFIATRWAFEGIGPFWTTALRFFLAFLIASPWLLRRGGRANQRSRGQFLLAAFPGFLLGATLCLQTYGLQFTTVTRCGFITVLYVVFVPLLEVPWRRKKFAGEPLIWVALALTGVAAMCGVFEAGAFGGGLNRGDAITLGCAFMAAVHILALESVASRIESSFTFNVYQSFWAALLPAALALASESFPNWPLPPRAWQGLFFLSTASTLVAFMIQVRTQKVLAPTVVSMLFLLESPFAAWFAFLFFAEKMDSLQWIGGALIVVAAVGTIRRHDAQEERKLA